MKNHKLLVVGDKFLPYAQGKEVITASQLQGLLSIPEIAFAEFKRTILIPGQGMGDNVINNLLCCAKDSANAKHFDFSLWHDIPERAPSNITHKAHQENILISTPMQRSENSFDMQLLIDENCELMADHQSGQHIQGMLLIEASRQAALAITENYFLPKNGARYAFVLNDMSVKYNNFAFPVNATITCKLTHKKIDDPRRMSFSLSADVIQCETSVSSVSFNFSAVSHERISRQESLLSQKTQKRFIEKINHPLISTDNKKKLSNQNLEA